MPFRAIFSRRLRVNKLWTHSTAGFAQSVLGANVSRKLRRRARKCSDVSASESASAAFDGHSPTSSELDRLEKPALHSESCASSLHALRVGGANGCPVTGSRRNADLRDIKSLVCFVRLTHFFLFFPCPSSFDRCNRIGQSVKLHPRNTSRDADEGSGACERIALTHERGVLSKAALPSDRVLGPVDPSLAAIARPESKFTSSRELMSGF